MQRYKVWLASSWYENKLFGNNFAHLSRQKLKNMIFDVPYRNVLLQAPLQLIQAVSWDGRARAPEWGQSARCPRTRGSEPNSQQQTRLVPSENQIRKNQDHILRKPDLPKKTICPAKPRSRKTKKIHTKQANTHNGTQKYLSRIPKAIRWIPKNLFRNAPQNGKHP